MELGTGCIRKSILRRCMNDDVFASFEITPPGFEKGFHDLLESLDALEEFYEPLFYSVTWHLRSAPLSENDLCPAVFRLAEVLSQRKKNVLLHLAARGLSKQQVSYALKRINELNINNIFALRGDYNSKVTSDYPYAVHLVKFIRKVCGTKTVICVAGYPRGHPEAMSYIEDLFYLKEKVDAGADFIITQIEFSSEYFIQFAKNCRKIGITIPILAGILPIKDYNSLERISKLYGVYIPQSIKDILMPIKLMDESVRNFGIYHAVETAKAILLSKSTQGLHFFTLNRMPEIIDICKQLGFTVPQPATIPWFHSKEYEEEARRFTDETTY